MTIDFFSWLTHDVHIIDCTLEDGRRGNFWCKNDYFLLFHRKQGTDTEAHVWNVVQWIGIYNVVDVTKSIISAGKIRISAFSAWRQIYFVRKNNHTRHVVQSDEEKYETYGMENKDKCMNPGNCHGNRQARKNKWDKGNKCGIIKQSKRKCIINRDEILDDNGNKKNMCMNRWNNGNL